MSIVLQYNSDIAYPELVLDSTGFGAQSPTRLPSFQTSVTSLWVSRPLSLLTGLLTIPIPLKFDSSLK